MPKTIIAVIPARSGSKRIKNKNMKIFCGKPLIYWTIKAAKESKLIEKVYVTSDSSRILNYSKKLDVFTIKRPTKLSNNNIMPDHAILHAYEQINIKCEYIVSLQPTSPLRTGVDIDNSISIIRKTKADSLTSVTASHTFLWEKKGKFYKPNNFDYLNRPRSQDSSFLKENGAILITKPKILIKNKNRLGGNISIFEMDKKKSIDVDTIYDFKLAEIIMKKLN